MKFSELLIMAIDRSEIPLRFEPGAQESVARPVTEFLRAWLQAHGGGSPERDAVLEELIEELDDARPVPV
jgi:hypothetical protein